MTLFTKFLSIIYKTLEKTGNLSPEFNTNAFVSLLFGANLIGIIYIIIINSSLNNLISKEIRYMIGGFVWIGLYLFISNLFEKYENEIISYKVKTKEYIYAFSFVFFLIGTFILMSNYTSSEFSGS